MTVSDGRIDARDWALLAALSMLWGGSFFFNGVVLRELPLFTVAVMAAAGEEKLIIRRVAGVIVGLVGVVILRGSGLDSASGQGLGVLLCLAAALSYGISALIARRALSDSPPLATATFQLM